MRKVSLHSSCTNFLATKLSHYTDVRPGLVQNLQGFGGLRESRLIVLFPEAGKVRSLKISCSLLVKSKWRFSWVKCTCKSVKRLEIIPIKREGTWLVASVRHFGYLRSSGRAYGCVYFDDFTVFQIASFSLSVHTRKNRFQKASFSNLSTLENVFEWLRFRWSFSAL